MPSAPEFLRLFFALNPGASVRQCLAGVQNAIRLPARPVHPDRLHLTLAFLGRIECGRVESLLDCAGQVAFEPCTLELDQLGWFERAGVAWLAPSRPPQALMGFQRELSAALAAKGFTVEDRRWLPHLTLYRDLRTPPGRLATEPVEWRVNGFVLMQSVLRKSGPVYRVIGRWPEARGGSRGESA